MRRDANDAAIILDGPCGVGSPSLVGGHQEEFIVINVGRPEILGGIDIPLGKVQFDR